MIELINDIRNTGYIENPKIGSYFHNKHPQLFNQIIKVTKDIENTYVINTTLRARVIFLINYNNDINNLKNGDKWMSFDRKKDDFIKKSTNSAKKGWNNKKNILKVTKVLSIEETISELRKLNNCDIYGKSKNRILMKKNQSLFKSIYLYSDSLKNLNKLSKKFPARILFIRDYEGNIENLKCPICSKEYCLYSEEKKMFNNTCKKCYLEVVPKYPQKNWFKLIYGNEWEIKYKQDRKKISDIKVNSEKWFIEKYGSDVWKEKRIEYIKSQTERISKLKENGVSKISQDLFWDLYQHIPNKDECYFSDLNKEVLLRDNDVIYFPYFVYKNKIIEYDGKYWHNEEKDKIRNEFYIKLGYDIYTVNSDEYHRGNKSKEIINKCLNFLLNED
jgi:hypothetical protein